jgi:hypothetical protein
VVAAVAFDAVVCALVAAIDSAFAFHACSTAAAWVERNFCAEPALLKQRS